MSAIIVDNAIQTKMLSVWAETEVRDDQGRRLGRFVPDPDACFFDIPGLDLDPEEVARRLSSNATTHSDEEVFARLLSFDA